MRFKQEWTASRYDGKTRYESFKANVPGNIQRDYASAFNFGDIMYSDNFKKFGEIEDYTWQYSATLNFEKTPDEELWFVAEGIDYSYDIMLDGKKLFSGEGMFSPVELNITDTARKGSLLQIIIHPHPKRAGAP